MPTHTRSMKRFEQARDVLCNPFTFHLGKLPGRGHMSASRQMIPQHVRLDTPDCSDGSARLINNIEAGPFVANHLLKPSDLAFDPAQPWQLPAVIGQRVENLYIRAAPHAFETASGCFSVHMVHEGSIMHEPSLRRKQS